MIIKIDVDGVIRDLVGTMCNMYNRRFAKKKADRVIPDQITDYNVDNFFPLIREKYEMSPRDYFFVKKSYDTFRGYANPFPQVNDAIDMLREDGHKIVICTWQFTHENKCATLGFLDDFSIEYDDICFTKDKWLVQSDIFIDDNPEFLLDEREKTSWKMIIDQPYNKNCNVNRYASLYDATLGIVASCF